jgi:addiction module RelE/StbE family toxin
MYEVVLTSAFKKAFRGLEKRLQKRVRKILEILKTRLIGEALKGDLKGFYSVHFERNKYRLIYQKEDDCIEVLAVHVGKRTDKFYNEFKKGLKQQS